MVDDIRRWFHNARCASLRELWLHNSCPIRNRLSGVTNDQRIAIGLNTRGLRLGQPERPPARHARQGRCGHGCPSSRPPAPPTGAVTGSAASRRSALRGRPPSGCSNCHRPPQRGRTPDPRQRPSRGGAVVVKVGYEEDAHGEGSWAAEGGILDRASAECGVEPRRSGRNPHGATRSPRATRTC